MTANPRTADTIEQGAKTPPKWLNVFMVMTLRIPILQRIVGRSVALISFIGRKTRTRYTIPVSYARDGSSLIILSRATRNWWHNFEANPHVELRLAGHIVQGRATAGLAAEDDLEAIRAFLEQRPIDARAYGLTADHDGRIDETDLRDLLGRLAVIEIELDDQ